MQSNAKRNVWILLSVCVVAATGFPGASWEGAATAAQPVKIFVSILPQRYFVERIGQGDVQVTVMVRPGADPATYEPSPRQMADLAQAAIYFSIGVPFEVSWLDRVQSNYPRLKVIATQEGIALREIEGHRHQGSLDGESVIGATQVASDPLGRQRDPHIWLDPLLVKKQAETIYRALATYNPLAVATYEENYREFARELDALDEEVRDLLGSGSQRRFMVFHPAWGYFADAYGLEQVPIEVAGKEPSPRELAGFIDLARQGEISTIFVQSQFDRKLAQAVAQAVGARIVQLDPLAEDYLANMRAMAAAIGGALK